MVAVDSVGCEGPVRLRNNIITTPVEYGNLTYFTNEQIYFLCLNIAHNSATGTTRWRHEYDIKLSDGNQILK